MGLGSFFSSALSSALPSTAGGWAAVALNLYMYRKQRKAAKRRMQNSAHAEHARRMAKARKQLNDLAQNYHRGGVKMAGTPSLALNALERKNVNEIDGYLNERLGLVKKMRSQTRNTMLGMIFKQHRRKWF